MIIACWIGNKATEELYSTSTMPGKILSKFNEEKTCFLPQFFVSHCVFYSVVNSVLCSRIYLILNSLTLSLSPKS
jgi:hypothetical protein